MGSNPIIDIQDFYRWLLALPEFKELEEDERRLICLDIASKVKCGWNIPRNNDYKEKYLTNKVS